MRPYCDRDCASFRNEPVETPRASLQKEPSVLEPYVPPTIEDGGNELDYYKVQLKLATDIINVRDTLAMCVCINVCACICVYTCMYMYVYVCVCMCLQYSCVCVYISCICDNHGHSK